MSALPRPRPTPLPVRAPNAGAVLAAAAYAVAAFAVYQLVAPAFNTVAEEDGVAGAIAAPAVTGLDALGPEGLTLRAIAGRVKQSTYVVEGAGGVHGSAFLGWVREQRNVSFVITARSVVAGMLTEGTRQVYLKRGNRFWAARIVRADQNWGLAVLRVESALERPLWDRARDDRGSLAREARAVLVPAGAGSFGEGILANPTGGPADWSLPTPADRSVLGAPVVLDDGRVGGVVTGIGDGGEAQVTPLAAACKKIRNC